MSSKFDFLEKQYPALAKYGREAEELVLKHPESSIMETGKIIEIITSVLYDASGLKKPGNIKNYTTDFRVRKLTETGIIPPEQSEMFDTVRFIRNKATHTAFDSSMYSKIVLETVYSLCLWFARSQGPDTAASKDANLLRSNDKTTRDGLNNGQSSPKGVYAINREDIPEIKKKMMEANIPQDDEIEENIRGYASAFNTLFDITQECTRLYELAEGNFETGLNLYDICKLIGTLDEVKESLDDGTARTEQADVLYRKMVIETEEFNEYSTRLLKRENRDCMFILHDGLLATMNNAKYIETITVDLETWTLKEIAKQVQKWCDQCSDAKAQCRNAGEELAERISN